MFGECGYAAIPKSKFSHKTLFFPNLFSGFPKKRKTLLITAT